MASSSTMATGALSVPAIRMQLDRKDQPHAFYKVQVETAAGTVQAGWKRWSECRQFAYAMMLQAIDAPKFPSHKFISVCSSDAFRLVSNRCLDPDYLERRRNSLPEQKSNFLWEQTHLIACVGGHEISSISLRFPE